ncbi:hypothetical protein Aduo_008626 [Ancylostoma duodenale]
MRNQAEGQVASPRLSMKNPIIGAFPQRIQMLPLPAPQFMRISRVLEASQPPSVTVDDYRAILQFLEYWHHMCGVFDNLSSYEFRHQNNKLRGRVPHKDTRDVPRGLPNVERDDSFYQSTSDIRLKTTHAHGERNVERVYQTAGNVLSRRSGRGTVGVLFISCLVHGSCGDSDAFLKFLAS